MSWKQITLVFVTDVSWLFATSLMFFVNSNFHLKTFLLLLLFSQFHLISVLRKWLKWEEKILCKYKYSGQDQLKH